MGRVRIRESGAGVEGSELARPLEDTVVGGEESVAFEGGGDDYAVCGVPVHSGQESCARCYDAIYGNFNDAILDDVFSPRIQMLSKVEPTLLGPHPGFPEGYGRDCSVSLLKPQFDFSP